MLIALASDRENPIGQEGLGFVFKRLQKFHFFCKKQRK